MSPTFTLLSLRMSLPSQNKTLRLTRTIHGHCVDARVLTLVLNVVHFTTISVVVLAAHTVIGEISVQEVADSDGRRSDTSNAARPVIETPKCKSQSGLTSISEWSG